MTKPSWTAGPPRRVLLATDLSARCDRALDRAAALAVGWRGELVALHVLEQTEEFYVEVLERRQPAWRRLEEMAQLVERQLREDVSEAPRKVAAVVERGDPAEVVLKVAQARDCGLIVTGLARDETLGRFGLGSTVDKLIRRSEVPLLVVKKRVRAPYRHVVVATDFSDCTRHAMQAALSLFPEAKLSLFHAYEPRYADMTAASSRYDEESRQAAIGKCAEFLASVEMPDGRRQGVGLIVERGRPGRLLQEHVHRRDVDLVAIGIENRNALLDILLGSSKDILSDLPCDALLVREPSAP